MCVCVCVCMCVECFSPVLLIWAALSTANGETKQCSLVPDMTQKLLDFCNTQVPNSFLMDVACKIHGPDQEMVQNKHWQSVLVQ